MKFFNIFFRWLDSLGRSATRNNAPYYRAKIMTDNELDFHQTLKFACARSSYEIWPQVAMLALLQPRKDPKVTRDWAALNAISNRRVDWVIARDGEPLVVIELDDRTHNAAADRVRDDILTSCGYQVARFDSRKKPDAQQLRKEIDGLANTRR